ncbi:MAG TPA: ABC transporter permease [Methylomirabilota bacterium]|nr:ABC transporter permease [Methylomirabilota bacterium]
MGKYIVRRLLLLGVVLFGVSTLIFVILRLSGDPTALFVTETATAEDVQKVRQAMGFDDPLYVQYGRFLARAAVGDFGTSFRFSQPAIGIVLQRFPATLALTLAAIGVATLAGVPLGVVAALTRGSGGDRAVMVVTFLGQAVPTFWLGIMMILFFAVELKLFPASGGGTAAQLVLPGATLGIYMLSRIARITRSSMLEVLRQDYIRTARAKGLRERAVVLRHGLKSASISIVTMIGFTFATLIGGAIVTETVFAWPGVGRLLVEAVYTRDYPVVQAAVFVTALFVATCNLLTDLLYAYLDPRIRYG